MHFLLSSGVRSKDKSSTVGWDMDIKCNKLVFRIYHNWPFMNWRIPWKLLGMTIHKIMIFFCLLQHLGQVFHLAPYIYFAYMFGIYLCILNCLCQIETAAWKSDKNLLKKPLSICQSTTFPVFSPTRPYGVRKRDPGWVWSCGSRTKLILREKSFVSQFCVLFTQWLQRSARAR